MNGKNLLEGRTGPITQSVDAVKLLLSFVGRASDPLPTFAEFGQGEGRVVLVLSNKRDSYYTVTSTKCSCPSATYHNGRCKHQRRHFPQEQAMTVADGGSIRPEGKWAGGMNGPVSTIPGEERAAKVAPSMLIDLHDTSDREAAYHSIREDKIMWPAEA